MEVHVSVYELDASFDSGRTYMVAVPSGPPPGAVDANKVLFVRVRVDGYFEDGAIWSPSRITCPGIVEQLGLLVIGHWPIQKLSAIQKLRFRNYDSETISADSRTSIQKLFSADSETIFGRFRNYFRPIQKLFSTDSETIFDRFRNYDSETIFDRFRNYFRPIQKLFSTDSETIFDRFRNYDSETIFNRFRNYFRPIQKLFSTDSETIFDRFRNYLFSTDSETIFDRFRNYDSETIFDRVRNYVRPIQKLFSTEFNNIPFIKIFPPPLLATHASMIEYNIPFIKIFPPPLGNPCFQ